MLYNLSISKFPLRKRYLKLKIDFLNRVRQLQFPLFVRESPVYVYIYLLNVFFSLSLNVYSRSYYILCYNSIAYQAVKRPVSSMYLLFDWHSKQSLKRALYAERKEELASICSNLYLSSQHSLFAWSSFPSVFTQVHTSYTVVCYLPIADCFAGTSTRTFIYFIRA